MQINTALFGPQEIQDDELITFPQGLPGFEENTRFKVFHEEGKPTVHWLQSVDDAELCFSVMEPDLLNLGYEFELSDEQTQILEVTEGDELIVVLMLSKAGNSSEQDHETVPNQSIRANLQGPLVINLRARKALQASLPKVERITLIRGIA
ncbi:flagellar assembly protein FliW [Nitrincola schmidtii]|uniref:flagellar assembly protein FliW n=1 Tax=Nitrincola schmidtii TaxID=1730894 RepID=UPI00124C0249|nr:flagellar assembly protein FliW [Nitrincola schmidtii]